MRQIRFEIVNDAVKENAIRQIKEIQPDSKSPLVITIQEKTRSLSQNALLWALLTDVSDQVNWYGKKLSPEDWKAVFTAGLKKYGVVPNLDKSGFVVLGTSTSRMSKAEFSELIELIYSFGAEHGVQWSGDTKLNEEFIKRWGQ
ncbi:recombination protein NinB [Escherichia coli]|nr:recombination protein NinB [Escherichia coli]